MEKGFFGTLFDFNGDGKLNDFEQAADFAAFMSLLDEEKQNDDSYDDFDEEDSGDYFDDRL